MPSDGPRQIGLFGGPPGGGSPVAPPPPRDASARAFAMDPRHDVVLEASAGTGKTSVLVGRYLNLLAADVDPANILAMTFTRKAAAEMRDRILRELKRAADQSPEGRRRWLRVRDRTADIAIGTIDAFCLSILREFPLEADLDPSFDIADETELARIVGDVLDRTLQIARAEAGHDEDVALVFAHLPAARLREGLRHLLERRLVAPAALARFVRQRAARLTAATVAEGVSARVLGVLETLPDGLDGFLRTGPTGHPRFRLLAADLRAVAAASSSGGGDVRTLVDEVRAYFLTSHGEPRRRPHGYAKDHWPSEADRRHHAAALAAAAPAVREALAAFSRDLNALLARGVWRIFSMALGGYRRALEQQNVLDFTGTLERAVELLRQMDEFAQSRFRLESRYHHVLVDEFQDTSRLQWELVSLLVRSWGEGSGLVHEAPVPPSIFIVGDRKQSIYRFRDAEVAVLEEAGRFITALRPGGSPRRSITHSFRAVPELLAFVNDLFDDIARNQGRVEAFRFGEDDRFPVDTGRVTDASGAGVAPLTRLGLVAEPSAREAARAVAEEVSRLIADGQVRDPQTGVVRGVRPGDVAILFRTRDTHREYEAALEARRIPTYVYKGLGFFDADEIKDLAALLRYLAAPHSPARTAAFLRSRFIRVSDRALLALRTDLPASLLSASTRPGWDALDDEDRRVLLQARAIVPRWLAAVDRLPPAEVLDAVIAESSYLVELEGPRAVQARENVKKLRALVRRLQNRGYATVDRIATRLDHLSAGDESNAVVDAADAVNLMTVHAAKGLEFPVVFVVDVGRGSGTAVPAVRVIADGEREPDVSIAGFESDADEAELGRAQDETKRLLYVALTRARDHLYLAAVTRRGAFRPAHGSLGDVLPRSLCALFERAAAVETGTVVWETGAGRHYHVRVCRAPNAAVVSTPRLESTSPPGGQAARTGPAALPLHVPAAAFVPLPLDAMVPGVAPADPGAVAGHLVHRLLRAGLGASSSQEAIVLEARRALGDDERGVLDDVDGVIAVAAEGFRALVAQADILALLSDGVVRYEVPFSMRVTVTARPGDAHAPPPGRQDDAHRRAGTTRGLGDDWDGGQLPSPTVAVDATAVEPRVARGVIDCLVRTPAGEWVVVDVKTGPPAGWHEAQLALYVEAVRQIVPNAPVAGRLVYV